MSKSENVVLGLIGIAALLYFGTRAKADQSYGGVVGEFGPYGTLGPDGRFKPGGAVVDDAHPSHGVTGSWLTLKNPIL